MGSAAVSSNIAFTEARVLTNAGVALWQLLELAGRAKSHSRHSSAVARTTTLVKGSSLSNVCANADFFRESALPHERTSAVVPKNMPESFTLRMLYPAFSHERQEDIGPFG